MRSFIASFGPRKRKWACDQAGVSESAIRAFENGDTQSLEETTYEKLSTWSYWTVEELKGDAPAPTRENILSRKSENGVRTTSDRAVSIVDTPPRTEDGPEREANMGEELRLEIVNKIWALPDEFLEGLKNHIQAIERAQERRVAHPTSRGRTGL